MCGTQPSRTSEWSSISCMTSTVCTKLDRSCEPDDVRMPQVPTVATSVGSCSPIWPQSGESDVFAPRYGKNGKTRLQQLRCQLIFQVSLYLGANTFIPPRCGQIDREELHEVTVVIDLQHPDIIGFAGLIKVFTYYDSHARWSYFPARRGRLCITHAFVSSLLDAATNPNLIRQVYSAGYNTKPQRSDAGNANR